MAVEYKHCSNMTEEVGTHAYFSAIRFLQCQASMNNIKTIHRNRPSHVVVGSNTPRKNKLFGGAFSSIRCRHKLLSDKHTAQTKLSDKVYYYRPSQTKQGKPNCTESLFPLSDEVSDSDAA